MKIVYLYNGALYVCRFDDNGNYIYPNDEYTEIPPPEGIYQPFYFDGEKWIGASREEWLENHTKPQSESNEKIEIESLKQRIEELENKVKELTKGTD